jgi:CRP-like cAMP-binding protein
MLPRCVPEADPNRASGAPATGAANLPLPVIGTQPVPILLDLSEADLFRRLPGVSLARLIMLSRASRFPAGSWLLGANRDRACLFVIASGRVRVEWLCPHLARVAVVGELRPGDTVGELGIIDSYRPTLTVVAIEDTKAWLLAHSAVALTMLHDPETRAVLGERLAARRRAFDAWVNSILHPASSGSSITI